MNPWVNHGRTTAGPSAKRDTSPSLPHRSFGSRRFHRSVRNREFGNRLGRTDPTAYGLAMNTGKKITALIDELEEKFAAEGHSDRGLLLGSEAVSGLMILAADLDALAGRLERIERRLDRLETSGSEQSFDRAAELADLRRRVAKVEKSGKSTKKKKTTKEK
jgi:hypothetical protein